MFPNFTAIGELFLNTRDGDRRIGLKQPWCARQSHCFFSTLPLSFGREVDRARLCAIFSSSQRAAGGPYESVSRSDSARFFPPPMPVFFFLRRRFFPPPRDGDETSPREEGGPFFQYRRTGPRIRTAGLTDWALGPSLSLSFLRRIGLSERRWVTVGLGEVCRRWRICSPLDRSAIPRPSPNLGEGDLLAHHGPLPPSPKSAPPGLMFVRLQRAHFSISSL